MKVNDKNTWPKCIFFGDSITQRGFNEDGCFLSIVASRFQRRLDIVNRGFSGYTTRVCLPLLKLLFTNPESLQNTAAFFIFLGANDASFESQKVELPEYKQNLGDMVKYLTGMKFDRERIFLVTPPPVDEIGGQPDRMAQDLPFSRTFEHTKTYADACVEVAKSEGVHFVNLFSAMSSQEKWKRFLIDGLHFSRSGGQFCAQVLGDILEPLAPPSMLFPQWRDIIEVDPSTLFKY